MERTRICILFLLISLIVCIITVSGSYPGSSMTGQLFLVPSCLEYNMITPVRVILMTEDKDVSELGFTLLYDADKLSIIRCLTGDLVPAGGWDVLVCEEVVPGELEIYAFSETGSIPAGQTGDLFQLDYCCTWESVGQGDETSIQVTNLAYDLIGFISAGATLRYGGG